MANNIKKLALNGLDCALCAGKIEEELKKISAIDSVNVNFTTKMLTFRVKDGNDIEAATAKVIELIKTTEPDINVTTKATEETNLVDYKQIAILGTGTAMFIIANLFDFPYPVNLRIFLMSYLLIGGEVLLRAMKNLFRGQVFDENFLMSIATVGAFAIGEYPEGVAVMLFYKVGELFQDIAVNRSRRSITALLDIRPDYANLKIGEEIQKVAPEEVNIGAIILVKPGEKIPLDGKIIEGNTYLDTSALTGESKPIDVSVGDNVLSGSINKNSLISIEVTKVFADSTVTKILDLVQNATEKKAPTENFITKFARYYTPIVVFFAIGIALIPPYLLQIGNFNDWLYRALVFLVISCPCALVVSIPLGFFGGIGGASKNGILVKGGNYLEALNNVNTVIFDKTGTLTKGVFEVNKIVSYDQLSQEALLELAAYAESFSNHPIAQSIQKAYPGIINKGLLTEYNEIAGYGIKVLFGGQSLLVGNGKLMLKENIPDLANLPEEVGTILHVALDGQYQGYIIISDTLKSDSKKAIERLKALGVKTIALLTGDNQVVANKIANELNIDLVFSELLPGQKVAKLEELKQKAKNEGNVVFVGDGINDAPVLAQSDVGVAMGGLGSDAAIEAADVVIMTDEPSKLAQAIEIAKKTRSIVWQNIIFAFIVKGIFLVLGAFGYATMWEAVFADGGVAVLAVLNATRVLNYKKSS